MEYDGAYETGVGWRLLASLMLFLAGTFNIIWGIGALTNADLYVKRLLVGNLNTWGWIWLIVGIVELIAGIGVLMRVRWARWFGIVMASISAVTAFFHIWSQPGWALLIIGLDIMVLYGLAVYGGNKPRVEVLGHIE